MMPTPPRTYACEAMVRGGDLMCSKQSLPHSHFCARHTIGKHALPGAEAAYNKAVAAFKVLEDTAREALRKANLNRKRKPNQRFTDDSFASAPTTNNPPNPSSDPNFEVTTQQTEIKIIPANQGFVIDDALFKKFKIKTSILSSSNAPGYLKIPKPMCGWTTGGSDASDGSDGSGDNSERWKDVRQCTYCKEFGDSDAGVVTTKSSSGGCIVINNNSTDIDDPTNLTPTPTPTPPNIALGRLLPIDTTGGWAHYKCAYWTSDVFTDNVKDAGIDLSIIRNVFVSRSRTNSGLRQYDCPCCKKSGASIGCCYAKCPHSYHFACAIKSNLTVFCRVGEMWKLYCKNCLKHESNKYEAFYPETFPEPMTSVSIQYFDRSVNEKQKFNSLTNQIKKANHLCQRMGALTVHSFGQIMTASDSFHNANYIFPLGYCATRIFWSPTIPRSRAIWFLRIEASSNNKALFRAIAVNNETTKACKSFSNNSIDALYEEIRTTILQVNSGSFDKSTTSPKATPRDWEALKSKSFGLSGPQFFGFGLNHVRKILESLPGVECVVVPLTKESEAYKFSFKNPVMADITTLQRKRAGVTAEEELLNPTGCARTEGLDVFEKAAGEARITRVLLENEEIMKQFKQQQLKGGGGGGNNNNNNNNNGRGISNGRRSGSRPSTHVTENGYETKESLYHKLKSVPLSQRLQPLRSHIHGWGLFTKVDLQKNAMIIEYVGQKLRSVVGDVRERNYEENDIGSCYMFRIDPNFIVDATMVGCMARFMNHCCQPNAIADTIRVGAESKIIVFANQFIPAGSEITYDYKFPVEDGSLRCTCGHPDCIGRMN